MPFFVEVERGDPLMRELGYVPEPELSSIRIGTDIVLNGYQVPRGQIRKVRQQLSAAGVIFHRPKTTLSLADQLAPWESRWIAYLVGSFLDVAGTATARATFYNTLEELSEAEEEVHQSLFDLDRGLYAALLALPGVTDRTRQLGIRRLLGQPEGRGESAFLDDPGESELVEKLLVGFPPPRMLKFFGMVRESRINNARTRRLILRSILAAPRLELWATRYRAKLRPALTHALGVRDASILGAILAKQSVSRSDSERSFLIRRLGRYCGASSRDAVFECVGFIMGNETGLTLPLLRAYVDAKENLEAGETLPFETLEGLRSRYHQDRTSAEVLELTRDQLTVGQRIGLQQKAESDGVDVEFDPLRYDPVRLYLYAFERGLDEEIDAALREKAAGIASDLPIQFQKVGILVDASASMGGHGTQPLRPMAVVLALRDVLLAACPDSPVRYCGGEEEGRLARPRGDTSLAEPLVELLAEDPEAVFILSDGYENAPAGRVAEVMDRVRKLGHTAPVYQLSPVFAAETGGLRSLSPGDVPAVPVNEPKGLGLALLRSVLFSEPRRAIGTLVELALLEGASS
jgi:hypothetical protein